MRKRPNAKASTKGSRKAGKLADLPAKAQRAGAVKGGTVNQVQGNFIGTDPGGTSTPTKGK